MPTKTCIRCKEKVDELLFPKTGRNRSRGNVCITCRNIRQTILRKEKLAQKKHNEQKDINQNALIIYYTSIPW